ncbi:Tfp pilus assembly protein FimT/FimU [Ensifer soli]|uniref:Tfp pilus assembly protein FimT/FimU n=1 Tax=Ciceribacter sp. sgz301302 TaxID=3342379 RepID=UPI0035BAE157
MPCREKRRPTASSRLGGTVSPAGQAPMPISPTTSRRRRENDGFSMLETVLALVILGLLASLGLPFNRSLSGTSELKAKTFEIVTLLRAERNAAIRRNRVGYIAVDVSAGVIRSERLGAVVRLPPSLAMRLRQGGLAEIAFYPDGRASDAMLSIMSKERSVDIGINAATAAVSIADPRDASR